MSPHRGKKSPQYDFFSVDHSRRQFLIRCCRTATLLPSFSQFTISSPRSSNVPAGFSPDGGVQLQPHYRAALPLETVLAKVKAGSDDFALEKYHDQLSRVLARWSQELLQSPSNLSSLESVLADDCTGCSLRVAESRRLRSGPAVEIRVNRFSPTVVRRNIFIEHLRLYLGAFSSITTAQFEITQIDAPAVSSPAELTTRVRYQIVGSTATFYRQQRIGDWQLEWKRMSSDDFRISSFYASEETESLAQAPAFRDISFQVLGSNASYGSQLLLGADYWRTVLDGASGIDLYGHNGVSIADVDNDGFDDLYVCQPAGLPNRLYRNRGNGTFEDVTDSAGVGVLENTACALFADVDNDGRQELIVVCANGPQLFLNEGSCKFRPKGHAFDFAQPPQGTFTGAAIADYDRDGWLDIYFCLYAYYQGTGQYKYPLPYYDATNGPPNFLMCNNRDGTFRDVTAQAGLDRNNTRYSFCCAWSDINRDGWPDLYVVNDFGKKNLYRNNGDGTFTDIAAQAGVEDIGAGMSVCWFDCVQAGTEDLYVADMWTAAGERISSQAIFQKDAPEDIRAAYRKHSMGNSLFRNQGSGRFRDRTASAGVAIGRWAWSSDTWDFDHDGFPDLYIVNGMVSGPIADDLNSFFWRQVVANSPNQVRASPKYEQAWMAVNELIRSDLSWSGYERNIFYVNNHDGSFSDASGALGIDFIEDGRSFALGDFDHDGRLEAVLKNRNGPQVRILKNIIQELSPAIAFRLRGTHSNRDAIGAVVTLDSGSGRQIRSLQAGSGFLSQHSKELFFGLGQTVHPVRAQIQWPSGRVQELNELPLNHRIWVEEGSEPSRIEPFQSVQSWNLAKLLPGEQFPASAETWLLDPVLAPDFSLPDLKGQKRAISQFRGKPALAYFWSSRTPAWVEELQAVNDLVRQSFLKAVIAINVDDQDRLDAIRLEVGQRSLRFPIVQASPDLVAIYNILYRQLFDRHRDLRVPTAFLINSDGEIVKLYQGVLNLAHIDSDFRQIPSNPAERAAKALPFAGISGQTEFRRNYLSYGAVYYQRGYYDQAEDWFGRALRDDPANAEALYGLGSVYLEQQKNAEARRSFEKVTELVPSYPDTLPNAWNNLGLLATREGQINQASRYFQQALKVSPHHPIALLNLGNAYRQMKQWDEARNILEQAVVITPDNAEANYSLGMVFAELNDANLAHHYLETALKLRPQYPEALNNLGILYLRTQRRDQAVGAFEQSIRIAPQFDQPYLNLARVYVLEGNRQKARSLLEALLVQHPGHEQAQRALAELGR
ncbi:MAG: VCBS repeat-containing protein [Acidobacteria bacterium]|nr:VCBS repeat-containing protein [Acidobacteriota bacterium]